MLVPGPIDSEDGRVFDFKLEGESLFGIDRPIGCLVPVALIIRVGGSRWKEHLVAGLGRVGTRRRLSIVEKDTLAALPSTSATLGIVAER